MKNIYATLLSIFAAAVASAQTTAVADVAVKQASAYELQVLILANDQFAPGSLASVAVVEQPEFGSASIDANGTSDKGDDVLKYAHNSNFIGTETMTYQITDNQGNVSQATVTITVEDVADSIMANPDDLWIMEDDWGMPLFCVQNDYFGVNGPGNQPIKIGEIWEWSGMATVNDNGTYTDPSDDTILFSPSADYNGYSLLQYYIMDAAGNVAKGEIQLYIAPVNDIPYAIDDYVTVLPEEQTKTIYIAQNDWAGGDGPGNEPVMLLSQPMNGQAQLYEYWDIYSASIVYTRNPGFVGTDSFTYQIVDSDGDIAIGTVHITALGEAYIEATVFLDQNANGARDAGEPFFKQANVSYEENDGMSHVLYAQDGVHYIPTTAGNNYDVHCKVYDPERYAVTVPDLLNIPAPFGMVTPLEFAITAIPFIDAKVTLYCPEQARPGFATTCYAIVGNLGTETISSGILTFTKDEILPAPTGLSPGAMETATGFTYAFGPLAPQESVAVEVVYTVPVIPNVNLGDLLQLSASVSGVADDDVADNDTAAVTKVVVGSYDPNDITESHGGTIAIDTFDPQKDYLYYTIRFENTGTAAAETVRVEMELDDLLDASSLTMVHGSHSYQLQRDGSHLEWTFDDIMLAPSVPETQIGKGYVIFAVKVQPGIEAGDVIPASADIYFDFNPAIVTENFDTQFVPTLATIPIHPASFAAWPNPVRDVLTIDTDKSVDLLTICDYTGKTLRSTAGNSVSFNGLAAGFYLVRIESAGRTENIRVVKE